MKNSTMIISGLAGTIASIVSGAIVFGFVLNPYQATHTVQYVGLMKETENYGLAMLAQIPFAVLFVYLFSNWNSRVNWTKGLLAGGIVGALIGLCFAMMTLAQMNLIDWIVVITDVIGHALWGGITGSVVAGALSRNDRL